MFHYSTKASIYGINNPDTILYKKDDHNPLINEFGIYIIDRLCTFQNMQHYTVTPDTDLDDYVTETITLHDGTVLYCFSKELLAYLETIVAFSPYYIQNDPRTAGVMDNFYSAALQAYASVSYKDLHQNLIRRLKAWYEIFKPVHPKARPEVKLEEAQEGDVVTFGAARPQRVSFSLNEEEDDDEPPPTPPAPKLTEAGSEGGQPISELAG
jgi:hypothetical protein